MQGIELLLQQTTRINGIEKFESDSNIAWNGGSNDRYLFPWVRPNFYEMQTLRVKNLDKSSIENAEIVTKTDGQTIEWLKVKFYEHIINKQINKQ